MNPSKMKFAQRCPFHHLLPQRAACHTFRPPGLPLNSLKQCSSTLSPCKNYSYPCFWVTTSQVAQTCDILAKICGRKVPWVKKNGKSQGLLCHRLCVNIYVRMRKMCQSRICLDNHQMNESPCTPAQQTRTFGFAMSSFSAPPSPMEAAALAS